MMERDWPGDGWVVHCDDCSAEDMSRHEDWASAWANFKRTGWRARQVAGVWEHRCPACAQMKGVTHGS